MLQPRPRGTRVACVLLTRLRKLLHGKSSPRWYRGSMLSVVPCTRPRITIKCNNKEEHVIRFYGSVAIKRKQACLWNVSMQNLTSEYEMKFWKRTVFEKSRDTKAFNERWNRFRGYFPRWKLISNEDDPIARKSSSKWRMIRVAANERNTLIERKAATGQVSSRKVRQKVATIKNIRSRWSLAGSQVEICYEKI